MQNLVGWFLATLVLLGLGVLVAAGVLQALGVLKRIGIAPRCDPSSPDHSMPPNSCKSVSQYRNPSWSMSPTGTRSPKVIK